MYICLIHSSCLFFLLFMAGTFDLRLRQLKLPKSSCGNWFGVTALSSLSLFVSPLMIVLRSNGSCIEHHWTNLVNRWLCFKKDFAYFSHLLCFAFGTFWSWGPLHCLPFLDDCVADLHLAFCCQLHIDWGGLKASTHVEVFIGYQCLHAMVRILVAKDMLSALIDKSTCSGNTLVYAAHDCPYIVPHHAIHIHH